MTKILNKPKKCPWCPESEETVYETSQKLWIHKFAVHGDKYKEFAAKKKASGPKSAATRRLEYAKREGERLKAIEALARKENPEDYCCGVHLPNSLSAWRRHKTKHSTCPRADGEIKSGVARRKEIVRERTIKGASWLAGEGGEVPVTDSHDGLVKRIRTGLATPSAHTARYKGRKCPQPVYGLRLERIGAMLENGVDPQEKI